MSEKLIATPEAHIACAGLGVNTIAYLILCTRQGIKFDHVLFSDPGKEWPKTYAYIDIINKWLTAHGQPKVTIVYKTDLNGDRLTLYQDNLHNQTIPAIAFGFKTCSQKFKRQPQDKFLNNDPFIRWVKSMGGVVYNYIGFDADESHRTQTNYDTDRVKNIYPLVDADMGRFECVKLILDEGLPLPPKSSCTDCPSMKPWEIIELYETEPKEFYDAIALERAALPHLSDIKGLGRDFSWWDLIVAYRYLKLIKRYNNAAYIPPKIKKLILKINRSKPIDYKKLAADRKNAKDIVCDLFTTRVEAPCECMY